MEIKAMPNNNKSTPKIIFSEQAYYDMVSFYTAKITDNKEFMFIGVVDKLKNNVYHITDIKLIPQTANSGAFCETDDDAYPAWLHETFPNVKDKLKVRLNGHSHVNMAVEPSGVDNQNIERMMQYVDDYFIQLIINRRQEIKINLWDKESGLIFNTCAYFIQIGEALLKIPSSNTAIPELVKLPELKLEDFKPTIYPNIYSNGTVVIDLLSNKTSILTEKLEYKPGMKISVLTTDTDAKEIEAQFTKLLKQPKYVTPTYQQSSLYDDYYDEAPYYYEGFRHRNPQPKGGKKNGTKKAY